MSKIKKVRFLLRDGKDDKATQFVYRPPNAVEPKAMDAPVGVKFAQRRHILDNYWIMGGTRWSRMLLRLKHPIIYSKRGLKGLYRRIKRIFIKELPAVMCRKWKNKEELLHK